jgi:hypothetical protein
MLKINSNFSDYYDCAIGSFVDSDVTINRKNEKVKVNIFNEFPNSILKNLKMYDYSWSYHKHSVYGANMIHCVGFCGKWYYWVWVDVKDEHGYSHSERRYITFDEIIENEKKNSMFSFMNKYHDLSNDRRDLNNDEFFTKDIFEKYGPIIYCHDMDLSRLVSSVYRKDEDRCIEIEKFPNLKELGFSKVVDPYTALNTLEHWYDVHARPDEVEVPVGDDITRLQAYGFDKKTSFRKAKEK